MKSSRKWIVGIVVGVLLTCAPLFGLLGVVFGMAKAFQALGSSGIADPKGLSAALDGTLVSTAAGVLLCPVGIAILILSVVFFNRARRNEAHLSSLQGTPHV